MNDDTISRAAALAETWREPRYTDPLNVLTEIRERLRALPTAERKGHWTIGKDSIGHKRLICTLCGNGIAYMRKFDYCPNCGADMRGEQ